MKQIVPFLLSVMLLSGCATNQQQIKKPLCPKGQLPATCLYYGKSEYKLPPKVRGEKYTCKVCGEEHSLETSIKLFKIKDLAFYGTCDNCGRAYNFTGFTFAQQVAINWLPRLTCPYCGEEQKDLIQAGSRYKYGVAKEMAEFQEMLLLQLALQPK